MTKRATAQEVATAAGVSKWTVIRAFSEGASISEEKKRRVLEAAADLNYSPNLLARSLATRLSHQVAVFVDDFGNPEKLPFLELLTERLQAEGLVALLVNINSHFDHVRALLNAGQRQVDAVILLGTGFRDETLYDYSSGRGMPPLYVLARDSQIPGVPHVICDAELAMCEIVDYLFSKGYRKPAFMTGSSAISTALGREHFYRKFWKEKGISQVATLPAGRYSTQEGAAAIRQYLAETPSRQRCDVLMCENDILAIGALDVIRSEFKLRVPTDIAIVGFDNTVLAGSPAFDLTSYQQPISEMINAMIEIILRRREPQSFAFPGRLVLRQSA